MRSSGLFNLAIVLCLFSACADSDLDGDSESGSTGTSGGVHANDGGSETPSEPNDKDSESGEDDDRGNSSSSSNDEESSLEDESESGNDEGNFEEGTESGSAGEESDESTSEGGETEGGEETDGGEMEEGEAEGGEGEAEGGGGEAEDGEETESGGEPEEPEKPVEPVEGSFLVFKDVVFFSKFRPPVDPKEYPVPKNVIRHSNTVYGAKLTPGQVAAIQLSSVLNMTVGVGARCDDYDRIGGVYLSLVPKGEESYDVDEVERIEVARFITPFMDHNKDPNVFSIATILAR